MSIPESLRFQEHHLEHHIAHIASAYYCSPWEKAAGFSYDGSGDFVSTMMARCEGNEIEVLERVFLPHSLGSFYTMICEFIGYKKYGDEGKVMGLAPYGKDTYCEQIREIVRAEKRRFRTRSRITSCRWAAIREWRSWRTERCDWPGIFPIAWRNFSAHPASRRLKSRSATWIWPYAMQHRFEEVFFHLLNQLHAARAVGKSRHGRWLRPEQRRQRKTFDETPFRQTWIQPAREMKAWRSARPCTLITPCSSSPAVT